MQPSAVRTACFVSGDVAGQHCRFSNTTVSSCSATRHLVIDIGEELPDGRPPDFLSCIEGLYYLRCTVGTVGPWLIAVRAKEVAQRVSNRTASS